MNEFTNGLSLASSTWDQDEIKAAKEVLDSGKVTMGEKVKTFEQDFAKYFGSKYAVMVNSGSSANLLMIAALFYSSKYKLRPGDEVIVPAVSWSTTYYPLAQYGLRIKFVDIDIETLNFDLNKLQEAISGSTRLILAVNLLGNPNEFDKINQIIEDKDIFLVEDNCESLGAIYSGRYTGTFGLAGSFSTYYSHHISTIEGGMITTNDDELYQIFVSMRSHGWTRDLPVNNELIVKSEDPFDEMFNFILPGYNLRPQEISGSIGIEQLKKLPNLLSMRRKNAEYLKNIMADIDDIQFQKEIGMSSWFGFSLILKKDATISRSSLIEKFLANNIEVRPIVSGDFTQKPVIKHMNVDTSQDLSNSKYLDKNGLYVGNHHYDISDQIKLLRSAILDA